ncbi:518_t:CDS:2 [Cetraspora pellucida]|uniref:518_t:CDS:1 n=1 Tax=Cetraspora pellucida TaxID=1433469 RepID=A0A9N9B045_9GLOM|nr:518_t:CDS:2 [Cetraspora pellucida]
MNLLSTNGDKWKKERDIRRKLFQESRKEKITSEDKKEMNELDNIIEDDVNNYYENRYNNQEETEVAWQNYESIQHEYESEKKETNKGYGIVETDEENVKGKQVDYKVFCNENTEIPSMNIGHIRIENPVENGYIGTPVKLAKKGISIQPGIANDSHITIMNISSRNVKFNKGQHIGNVEKIQKNDENFLTKLPDLKDQKQIGHILTEYVDVFREKQEYATRVNIDEISPIELNLKNGMKESKIPIENTEWRSSALVITKKDGTKKIAIDYRNLNKYLEQYREPLPDSKQMLQTVSRYKYYITIDIKSAYWQLVMHENSKKY